MSDEPTDPRLGLAISDPGATTPRLPNESVTAWSARAILASDWFAERIAQARREGAAEVEARVEAVLVVIWRESQRGDQIIHHAGIMQDCVNRIRSAVRGDT